MTRNHPITERMRMQIIAETFNLTNRVQWGTPNTDICKKVFGASESQANLPQSFQFAMRVQF